MANVVNTRKYVPENMAVGFIGAGRMAQAMARGFISTGKRMSDIFNRRAHVRGIKSYCF